MNLEFFGLKHKNIDKNAMKKLFIVCIVATVALTSGFTSEAKGDWRSGIWNRDVSENLFSINIEAIPMMTEAYKNTTPWGAGFNAAFEHKMRPSIIHGKGSVGYGGHLGLTRYFGKGIDTHAEGANLNQTWDNYKSYTEIPAMLDVNFYLNFAKSNIFIGLSAGVNFMLGERDAALNQVGPSSTADIEQSILYSFGREVDVISIQKNQNNVSLTHIIPSFRLQLGYVRELSQDWKIRIAAGMEYQMKYSDEYKGFRIDADYYEMYHEHDSPAMMNPFVSVGFVYSL